MPSIRNQPTLPGQHCQTIIFIPSPSTTGFYVTYHK